MTAGLLEIATFAIIFNLKLAMMSTCNVNK